ncbi:FBD-associated F-box protein, partial [Striga asiatica]
NLGTDNTGHSKGKKAVESAKWTPETEVEFIQRMLEEVLNQICVGSNFTTTQWNSITSKLNERIFPLPPYEARQLHGKQSRLKTYWRQFHTMQTSAIGFGWCPTRNMITGSNEALAIWTQKHPKDEFLKNRTCPHYDELTTIFIGKTATGSLATASTQPPHGRTWVRRSPTPIPKNEMFSDSGKWNTPDSSRSTRRRRAPSQSNDTVMNSIAETRRALQQVATTTERAIAELEAYTDLSVDVVMLVCKMFEVPFNRRLFVSLKVEAHRRALIDRWVAESSQYTLVCLCLMSGMDDECNQYSDREDSSEQAEHELENSCDDDIDDCVETEDDMGDSADDAEEKVLVYAAQLDSLYEQLATSLPSTSQRKPRIKRSPVASTPFTRMDWINELYMGPDKRFFHSDNLPPSFYDLDYFPPRDEDNDNVPPSLHALDSIPQSDVDEETSGWNPSLNVSQSAYREQCALRDSIASALWADRGNRRA